MSWIILVFQSARSCCQVSVCISEFYIDMFTKSSVWCRSDLDSIGNMGNLMCLWEDDLRPGIEFARHMWCLYRRTYEAFCIRDFAAWLISRSHRVGPLRTDSHPHPILVKFMSYRARESIWGQKKRPRGVFIREDLTQATAQLTFQSEKRDVLVNWRKRWQVTPLGMSTCNKIIRKPVGVPRPRWLIPELSNYRPRKQGLSNPPLETSVCHTLL